MAKWFVSAKKADFTQIGETYHISPVVARIIRNRDVEGKENIEKYLYGGLEDLYSPALLKGVDEAVELLAAAIEEKKKIRVIGDYDVDGICSTYILKKGIKTCGGTVDSAIPHRIKDGYGINENMVKEAYESGIDMIVTCDNGIAAAEQIAYAKSLGMTCIVTDHHEIPFIMAEGKKQYRLPPAEIIIDPKQEGCSYPYQNICGSVVAWKLILRLWEHYAIDSSKGRELLELAGFATVCDVMELLDENRIIVKEALKSMADSANTGLKALLKVHNITPEILSAYHIGFILGPCFNATGRLDNAGRGLELLECENEREAVFMAAQLKELNESRKEMTQKGIEEAIAAADKQGWDKDRVMVVYLPDCHESLAGIIAGKLREKYSKPVFVLTRGEDCIKGSGRSIEAYSMYEEMTKCRDLFIKFGGHKMAAGLSLAEENVDVFRQKLNENCTLTAEDMEEKILIDVPMPMSYVTRGFLDELKLLEPFGTGNPKPVFAQKNLHFTSARIMGKTKNAARFSVEDEQHNRFTLVLFSRLEEFEACVSAKYGKDGLDSLFGTGREKDSPVVMSVIYYPGLNEYRGRQEIQYVMQHWC